ncbi:MAG: dihydroorotate dehydrogenase [Candidatus Bathyarchaeia archaeon]
MTKLSLAVDIAGLELRSPTMNAAGVLGLSRSLLRRVYNADAGAAVTKSIGPLPREGHKNPTLIKVEGGALNAMGLPNPGVDYFSDEIRDLDFPVVASFFGGSFEEFRTVAEKLSETEISALELNCSCPNVAEEMGMLAADEDNVEQVTREVKGATHLPVFVKLSPSVTDVVTIAQAAKRGGADAITATNTLKGISIDTDFKRPVLSNVTGGLSGPALKPVSLRCVWEISEEMDIPIIGCGGISTWRDAVEYILAGAVAVEIGTAIMTKGFSVFHEVAEGMRGYMERNDYRNIEDFRGVAHEI